MDSGVPNNAAEHAEDDIAETFDEDEECENDEEMVEVQRTSTSKTLQKGDEKSDEKPDDKKPIRKGMVGRGGISLGMLVDDGILKPGNSCLTMEYQGKRFSGDLLTDGQIRSCDTKNVFSSPSAWAIHCKQMINPEKKTGCGWSSLKYNGQKLDLYKAVWLKKNRRCKVNTQNIRVPSSRPNPVISSKPVAIAPSHQVSTSGFMLPMTKRYVVDHKILGLKSSSIDPNTLVSCSSFSSVGRMQPFTVTVSSNCMLLIDYHSHLTTSEVIGYLGGYWDVTTSNLAILQAFPCRCRLGDSEKADKIESEIRKLMYERQLMLVGWYHSHPFYPAAPTLRDIDSQMEYQLLMNGSVDSYSPCVGFICSPYSTEKISESMFQAYWVMPPPETNPSEYSKPMHMAYTMAKDTFLTADVLQDINLLRDFYLGTQDQVQFKQYFREHRQTFLQKFQLSLSKKTPVTQPGLEISLTENLTMPVIPNWR